jgi:hypothetical protein
VNSCENLKGLYSTEGINGGNSMVSYWTVKVDENETCKYQSLDEIRRDLDLCF